MPLKRILASPPVWALWVVHITANWGNYAFFTNIPKFSKEDLFIDIEIIGLISAFSCFIIGVFSLVSSQIADSIIRKRWLTVARVRKISAILGMIVPALILCLLWLTDCSLREYAIVIITTAVGTTGFFTSTWVANYLDISGRFSGILFAIGNTMNSLTGFTAPLLFGIVTRNGTHSAWAIAFTVCAAVLVVGALIYIAFGGGELQEWAHEETRQGTSTEPTELETNKNSPVGTFEVE